MIVGCRALALWLLLLSSSVAAEAQSVVRVPEDASDLTVASRQVENGALVLLAPGVYRPPPLGYELQSGKSYTVRAEQAGTVILDGGGVGGLLRIQNGDPTGCALSSSLSPVAGEECGSSAGSSG